MEGIDLQGVPETIAVRRRFLTETRRVSMIARSAMDEAWAGDIDETGSSTLIVMEGLVMYLTEADVKQILSIIGGVICMNGTNR